MVVVKLPLWKANLYSLMERIRIFYSININTYNFKFSVKEKLLLKHMFKKYMQKGGQYRYIRSIRYPKLIDSVKSQMVIATPEELAIVNRLSIVKKINVDDLMNFEIKALKEFAKEVGINAIASSKMKPEELAKEIIKAVDPKKGYSTEFVKWYESVPDSFINSIEVSGAPESEEKSATDNSELIEAINSCTKMGELKESIADVSVASSFAGFDISKFKLAGLCKKAMIDFLENAAGYRIVAATDRELRNVVAEATVRRPLVRIVDLQAGEYFYGVRGIDALGLEGREAQGKLRLSTETPTR